MRPTFFAEYDLTNGKLDNYRSLTKIPDLTCIYKTYMSKQLITWQMTQV